MRARVSFALAVALAASTILALASVACSGSKEQPTGSNDGADDAGDAANDATESGYVLPGPLPRNCPADLPASNVPCAMEGLWCEYGDGGTHSTCTTLALCGVIAKSGGDLGWQITQPDPATCGPRPSDCPASYGEPADAACPSKGTCDYTEGRCACVICDDYDGSPEQNQWRCRAWSDVPGVYVDGGAATPDGSCPAERPRLGTPCSDSTIVCGYDSCNDIPIGPYLYCDLGTWSVGPQTDSCNHPGCR
jgi:hypothetical protein